MAGNNRYIFEVVSDWSQPERAVKQYEQAARTALRNIQAASKGDKKNAPATPQQTRGRLADLAGNLAEQKRLAREQLDISVPGSRKARKIGTSIANLEREIKGVTREYEALGQGLGLKRPNDNLYTKMSQGIARAEKAIEANAAAHGKSAQQTKADSDKSAKAEQGKTKAAEDKAAADREAARKTREQAKSTRPVSKAETEKERRYKYEQANPFQGPVIPKASTEAFRTFGPKADAEVKARKEAERLAAERRAAQPRPGFDAAGNPLNDGPGARQRRERFDRAQRRDAQRREEQRRRDEARSKPSEVGVPLPGRRSGRYVAPDFALKGAAFSASEIEAAAGVLGRKRAALNKQFFQVRADRDSGKISPAAAKSELAGLELRRKALNRSIDKARATSDQYSVAMGDMGPRRRFDDALKSATAATKSETRAATESVRQRRRANRPQNAGASAPPTGPIYGPPEPSRKKKPLTRAERDQARLDRLNERADYRERLADPGSAESGAKRRADDADRAAALQERSRLAGIARAEAAQRRDPAFVAARGRELSAARAEEKRQLEAERRAFRTAERSGEGPRATMFQRYSAYRRDRRGEAPRFAAEEDTFGKAVGGGTFRKLKTTAQFAASGALLYGAVSFIKETITEASELQVELGLLKGQFEAAGVAGTQSFSDIKHEIIDISKETGVMATEVSKMTRRLQGIFRVQNEDGSDAGPDYRSTLAATKVAAQFSQVTGVDAKTITDEFVAVFKSFEDSANEISFEGLADSIVAVSQAAGVGQDELLEMTATLAPLANQLGFTTDELLGFSAAAISSSGKSASALGENFGRVLTDLSSKTADILKFYQDAPQLKESLPDLQIAIAEGDTPQVLRTFLQDWDKMSASMRQSFATKIFGRRESQSFVSILNQGQRTLELMDSDTSDNAAFEDMLSQRQDSVKFALERMERQFEEFGDTLYEAGLGDFVKVLIGAFSELGGVLTEILKGFRAMNDFLKGVPGLVIAMIGAWKLFQRATAWNTNRRNLRQGLPGAAGPGFLNPYAMGAGPLAPGVYGPPIPGAVAQGGAGYYSNAVNSALNNRYTGGITANLLNRGTRAGNIGAAGLGNLVSVSKFAAPLLAFAALNYLRTWEDRQVEEIKNIAQAESQRISEMLDEGKTEAEIRAELGSALSKTDQSIKSKFASYSSQALTLGGGARTLGAIALTVPDLLTLDPGGAKAGYDRRMDDLLKSDSERIEEERDKILQEAERDRLKPLLEKFNSGKKDSVDAREALLEGLKDAGVKGFESEDDILEAINRYLDDPTNDDAWEDIVDILNTGNQTDGVRETIREFDEANRAREQFTEAIDQVNSDARQTVVEELRRNVSTSGQGRGQLISRLRADLRTFRSQLSAAREAGNLDQVRDALEQVSKIEDEITELVLARYDNSAFNDIADMASGKDNAAAIARLTTQFQALDAEFDPNYNADAIAATINGANDRIDTLTEQLADLNTIPGVDTIDPNAVVDKFVGRNDYDISGPDLGDAVVDIVRDAQTTAEHLSATEAQRRAIESQIAEAQRELADATEQQAGAPDVIPEKIVDQQYEIVQEILQRRVDQVNGLIDATENVDEKERLLAQGIDVTTAEQTVLIKKQLTQGMNPARVESLMAALGVSKEAAWDLIAQSLISGDQTIRETMVAAARLAKQDIQRLERIIQNASRFLDPADRAALQDALDEARSTAQRNIDALNALAGIESGVVVDDNFALVDPAVKAAQDAQKDVDDERERRRQVIERKKILARNDPVAVADLVVQSALLDLEIARAIGDDAAIEQAITAYQAAVAGAADARRELQKQQISGQAAIMSAQANGDPLAVANAQKWAADMMAALATGAEIADAVAAQIEANNAVQDAMNDIAVANLEFSQAQNFGDPVRQAEIALQIAQMNVANAKGEAERLRALIAQMDAQRALQQAIVDVFMAWNDIAVAQREAAGDAIGAAQQSLVGIQKQLDAAKQMGDNMKVLQLTAEKIRAEAAIRDARLTEGQSDIDFALQMQQITTDQAIKQLELLLQIPGLTKDQIQQLQLKIKGLRDELSRDMQFNLPDVLMPTLYEARRLDQFSQAGNPYQGYQTMAPVMNNNTVVNNNITVNGANIQNDDQLASMIADRMVAPPRDSQSGRLI